MEKQRHGCLTAWLVLLIVGNAAAGLAYLFARDALARNLPSLPAWAVPVQIVLAVAGIAFAIALFQWRKWGFYGVMGVAIVELAVNLAINHNPVGAVLGLLGPAILYGVLQIGGERKGWTQLV